MMLNLSGIIPRDDVTLITFPSAGVGLGYWVQVVSAEFLPVRFSFIALINSFRRHLRPGDIPFLLKLSHLSQYLLVFAYECYY